MSIFAIAIRRSLGLFFFPIVLLMEAVVLFTRGTEWTQVWLLSASTVASSNIIVGPVAAAAGAAIFVERHRREQVMPAEAKVRDSLLRLAALAAWLLAAHLMAVLVAYALTVQVHGGVGPYDLRLIVLSMVLMLCYAGLGSLAGLWWPTWPVVPLVAFGSYALTAVTPFPEHLMLVGGGLGVGGWIGLDYRSGRLAVQALWFVSVAVAAMALLAWQGSRTARVVAVVAAAAAIVAASLPVPVDTLVPRADPALVCRERVCVDEEVGSQLDTVEASVRPILHAADELVVGVPGGQRVQQVVALYPRPQTTAVAAIGWFDDRPHVDPPTAAWAIVQAMSGCDEPQARTRNALMVSATGWLLQRAGIPDARPTTELAARTSLRELVALCR